MSDVVLRAKYARRFHLRDADKDGYLDWADEVRRVEALLAGVGEPAGSPRARAVLAGARAYWQGLVKLAGIDENGRLDEAAYVQALMRANELGTIGDLVRPSVEAHIMLVDRDGDGAVSLAEFTRSQESVGLSADRAREAFTRLDRDGDGQLTVDEWQQAVIEYYTSVDEDVPGRLVMEPAS